MVEEVEKVDHHGRDNDRENETGDIHSGLILRRIFLLNEA